jgi:hypothetical protein
MPYGDQEKEALTLNAVGSTAGAKAKWRSGHYGQISTSRETAG